MTTEGDAEFLGQATGMQRAGATEGDERELARIVAALDRQQADCLGHQRLGDADDAVRDIADVDPKRASHRLKRPERGVDVEPDNPFREVLRDDPAEDDVRVGDRRLLAAAAVASRPGIRPGALRADAWMSARIDPGDTPTTGPDFDEVHDRSEDRVTAGDRHGCA